MFIQGSLLRKDDLEKSPEVFNHKLRYFLKEEKKHPKPLKTKDNRPNQNFQPALMMIHYQEKQKCKNHFPMLFLKADQATLTFCVLLNCNGIQKVVGKVEREICLV